MKSQPINLNNIGEVRSAILSHIRAVIDRAENDVLNGHKTKSDAAADATAEIIGRCVSVQETKKGQADKT